MSTARPPPPLRRRLLPSPWLSLGLLALWLLLNESTGPGAWTLGAALALGVPILVRPLRPSTGRVRHPVLALRLAWVVLADMWTSSLRVVRGVLRRVPPRARFVEVPLDSSDPAVLAALAIVMCLTPDTLWAEVSSDRRRLLIHVFDLDVDDATYAREVKARYERPLMEVFGP